MKAVITVTGRDSVGIIARVAQECVLREYFAMIMLVDIDGIKIPFGEFVDKMKSLGDSAGLQISAMHEDIFNTMHHI